MTDGQKKMVADLYQSNNFRYNTLWELCEFNGISLKEAIHYIAETFRPDGCDGCRRVGPYMGNSDCLKCSRTYKDMYQKK
jgi:hypothetical protein